MTASPARFPTQVAKLIRRLASEHDGEVITTARAITRTLKANGFDLHSIAEVIEREPEQPRVIISREHEHAPSENITRWSGVADWCVEHDRGRLRANERAFVRAIARRY